MSRAPLQVGFVGAGGIARHHISKLVEIPECKIVALCDIDAARVKDVADPLGAVVYTDTQKMLDEAKLDALFVCVPPFAHGDVEVRAAEKGIHLFVEKPVNLYVPDALKAWAAIKKAGVLTQTGYSLRYLPTAVQLKKLLENVPVGSAHVTRWGGLPGVPWWRVYKQSGGQLVEMTTHQVDLLRWVMGEVAAVSASYSFDRIHKGVDGVTVPDTQAALLIFKSGASATVSTSCGAGKASMSDVHFVVKDGRIYWRHDQIQVFPEGQYQVPPAPAETPSVDAAFIRAVYSGQRALLRSPFDDALKSAAVTLACNKSAEEGGRLVKLEELLGEL